MTRFISVVSGSGIPSIKDTRDGSLVCCFFADKKEPEKRLAMMKVCMDALNTASARYAGEGGTNGRTAR